MGELGGLESKDLGSWGAVRGMEEPGELYRTRVDVVSDVSGCV